MKTETDTLHAVYVEDSDDDFLFLKRALDQASVSGALGSCVVDLIHVHSLEEFRNTVGDVDFIFYDLGLADSTGVEGVAEISSYAPTVIVTGRDKDDMALKAIHEGAQDYIVKSEISPGGLAKAFRFAIERTLHNPRSEGTTKGSVPTPSQKILRDTANLERLKRIAALLGEDLARRD